MNHPIRSTRKTRRFPHLVSRTALMVSLLAPATAALAQFNAAVTGTVEDSTGAIIPNATVTLTNTGTQQKFTATSSSQGAFRFNELPPATYKLDVTASGFKAADIDNIAVVAETPRNVDVKLDTGGATEVVTVNADTLAVLETNNAQIERTLTSEDIERLPIFGADPYELLRTAPGITGDGARGGTGGAIFLPNNVGPGGSNSGIYQTENQIQISADGQRVADNNILIDGVSVNSLTHGGSAVVTPNQEAVAGITVISTSYDAGDGRNTGAQVKTTTKSGTNQLHGSLYFLYNEPGLNSFNKYGGPVLGATPSRVSIKQRTYAASLGGPIIKDKLFLFGSFQGFSQGNNTISAPTYVETSLYDSSVVANRPGGLSAATISVAGGPRIHNLVASDCSAYANQKTTFFPNQVNAQGGIVTQTASSGPYCQIVAGGLDIGSLTTGGNQLGNYLPYNTIGTAAAPGVALGLNGAFVGGGLDGQPDITQAQLTVPSHSRGNQFQGRADYNATKKDLIAGTLFFTKLDNLTSSDNVSRAIGDIPFKPLNSAATLIYIHTFSASWLNELRSNGTRFVDNGPKDFGNINLGIPYTYIQNLPVNNIDYGVQGGNTTPSTQAQNTIEITDQATHTFGSHSIKFGGGVRWEQDNDNLDGGVRPDFAFAGPWNLANDAPLFESQTVNPATGLAPLTSAHFRSQTYYAYIQHDWKVSPTLTFNAGFRYEIQTPWHRKAGANSYLPVGGTITNSPLIGATLQPVQNLYNTDYGHYSPKLSFAWNPTYFNNKFVLRGGAATAYNHLDLSLFNNSVENGPGVFQFSVCCGTSTLDFSTPYDGGQIKYVHGSGNNLNSFAPNPAFTTGISASGFPNGSVGGTPATIEIYGVGPRIRNPLSYLYSLDTQTQLTNTLSLTVGYAGSLGRHYARLVNQNFLYANSATVNGATVSTLANPEFLAQTDSSQAYNAMNVRVEKRTTRGLEFDGTYTWSKGMDNITNGDQSDGAANQTDPANNRAEWGPSDNDVRNRFTGTVRYTSPKIEAHNRLLRAAINGYQVSSIVTLHSGFNWTPVVNNGFNAVPNAQTVSPIRPIAYAPGASQALIGRSCSNQAFETGSNFSNRGASGTLGGTNYYSTATPTINNPTYIPVVGRNSLTGPCYRDIDLSLGKQFSFEGLGHTASLRFQANLYNAFNLLQLTPITNEGFGTNVQSTNFGQSQAADAGRVVEFYARLQF